MMASGIFRSEPWPRLSVTPPRRDDQRCFEDMAPALVPHFHGNDRAIVLDHLVADDVGQYANRLSTQAFARFEHLPVIVDRQTITIVEVEVISGHDALDLLVMTCARDSTDNSRTELLFHLRWRLPVNKCTLTNVNAWPRPKT